MPRSHRSEPDPARPDPPEPPTRGEHLLDAVRPWTDPQTDAVLVMVAMPGVGVAGSPGRAGDVPGRLTVLHAEGAVEECFGVSAPSLVGTDGRALFGAQSSRVWPWDGLHGSGRAVADVTLDRASGGAVAARVLSVRDGDQTPARVISVVTAHRPRTASAPDALVTAVLASLPSQTAVVDGLGVVREVNPAWLRFWREHTTAAHRARHPGAGVGTSYLDVCDRAEHDSSPDAFAGRAVASGLRAVLDGARDRFELDYAFDVPGGGTPQERRWFQVQVVALTGVRGAIVSHTEITERKRHEAALTHQATHDRLTGELNRSGLIQALQGAVDRGTPFTLVFADLDGFKSVNDALGHRAGDDLLVTVTRRLRAAVGDAPLGRFGGDEFAVLLEGAPPAAAEQVAQRVVESLRAPVDLWGLSLALSVSVGVLHVDGDATTDELLRDADAAMYEAKRAGRDRYAVFDAGVRERAMRRVRMLDRLRAALSDPGPGGLSLQYQRIAATSDRRSVGAEALVRWSDSRLGQVRPSEFVSMAEDCGMIDALGAWVLGTACRDAVRLARPLQVHVNVSARELAAPVFVDTVRTALDASGLAPDRLCLEVTESSIMHDVGAAAARLADLRATGVRVALDDFGTGWSSLGQLSGLPIDEVKLDRSFVAALGGPHDRAAAVVRGILALADGLGLAVVAEGVETPAQLDLLAGLGCGAVQGHLIGRPGPLEALGPAAPRDPSPATHREEDA